MIGHGVHADNERAYELTTKKTQSNVCTGLSPGLAEYTHIYCDNNV